MQNPFTLVLGKSPLESISRLAQTNEIIDSFSSEWMNQQIYMITGVWGSGKTVMLTDISKHFRKDKDWIVIELNPDRDLLYSFAAKLYDQKNLKDLFIKAKLDLSVLRIGVSIEKSNPFLIFRGKLYWHMYKGWIGNGIFNRSRSRWSGIDYIQRLADLKIVRCGNLRPAWDGRASRSCATGLREDLCRQAGRCAL